MKSGWIHLFSRSSPRRNPYLRFYEFACTNSNQSIQRRRFFGDRVNSAVFRYIRRRMRRVLIKTMRSTNGSSPGPTVRIFIRRLNRMAVALRAEDFVLDPTKEQIVTFPPLPGEAVPAYLARRAASEFRPLRIGTFGGVRAGAIGYIAMRGRNIEDIRRLPGIEVLYNMEVVCEIRFTEDRKIYLVDNHLDSSARRAAIEPTQEFPVAISNGFRDIGYIQRMPEGMKQLYRGLPGLPSEVMNKIAGMAVAGAPPAYFGGAEARDGTVQPAYVNSNAGRRAAMIEKHEGAAASSGADGAGAGGGAAAPASTKNRRSRTHRATRRRRNRSSKQRRH